MSTSITPNFGSKKALRLPTTPGRLPVPTGSGSVLKNQILPVRTTSISRGKSASVRSNRQLPVASLMSSSTGINEIDVGLKDSSDDKTNKDYESFIQSLRDLEKFPEKGEQLENSIKVNLNNLSTVVDQYNTIDKLLERNEKKIKDLQEKVNECDEKISNESIAQTLINKFENEQNDFFKSKEIIDMVQNDDKFKKGQELDNSINKQINKLENDLNSLHNAEELKDISTEDKKIIIDKVKAKINQDKGVNKTYERITVELNNNNDENYTFKQKRSNVKSIITNDFESYKQHDDLTDKVTDLEDKLAAHMLQNAYLKKKLVDCAKTIATLKKNINELTDLFDKKILGNVSKKNESIISRLIEINYLGDEGLDAAATRIQALVRGNKIRKPFENVEKVGFGSTNLFNFGLLYKNMKEVTEKLKVRERKLKGSERKLKKRM
jgi:chromosome segregation ATPase